MRLAGRPDGARRSAWPISAGDEPRCSNKLIRIAASAARASSAESGFFGVEEEFGQRTIVEVAKMRSAFETFMSDREGDRATTIGRTLADSLSHTAISTARAPAPPQDISYRRSR